MTAATSGCGCVTIPTTNSARKKRLWVLPIIQNSKKLEALRPDTVIVLVTVHRVIACALGNSILISSLCAIQWL